MWGAHAPGKAAPRDPARPARLAPLHDPAYPSRMRRRARPAAPAETPSPRGVARAILAGAIVIALPILLTTLLIPLWGEGSTGIFALFMLSLIIGAGACFVFAGEGVLRIAYAMCIVVGAAFVSLSLHEARIFGLVPTLDAAATPDHRVAAGFVLPGAAPRMDLAREVTATLTERTRPLRGFSTDTTTRRGRFTVVPVVDAGWTPAQPVPVVAVLDHGPDRPIAAVTPAPWNAGRGVLRLLDDPLRDRAVRQALQQAGLNAAPGVVIGRWVESPGWARLQAATPLLILIAAALLGWALVILSAHPRIAAWLPAPVEGEPTAARAILLGCAALALPSLFALALRHAQVDPAVIFLGIGFAVVPSLMLTLTSLPARGPVGAIIAGVILVVFIPLAVAARGAGPGGRLPRLDGARLEDIAQAAIILAAGCVAWAVLVLAGRRFAGRG